MSYTKPGKYFRKGLTIIQLMDMFPSDEVAEQWFIEKRWPDGLRCAKCDGDNVAEPRKHPTMPFFCRDCKRYYSVKTNSVMHSSKIGYRKWAITIYMFVTSLKGVSSMKLAREIGVKQSTAWHMLHRIRMSFESAQPVFAGPVEVDEVYLGGLDRNRHERKKKPGRGVANKLPVAGIKDRATGRIDTQVVPSAKKRHLQPFVEERTLPDTVVYSDEFPSYVGVDRPHEVVAHSSGEYVRGDVHNNGMESHWAMLRRGIMGTYHHVSDKHAFRYSNEFSGRHNVRSMDTAGQMETVVANSAGKRLRYEDLIAA